MTLLDIVVFLPLAGFLILLFAPKDNPNATRWTALTSSWPLMRAGVPTQMSASSVLEIASSLEVVARSLPARTWAASSSSSPGSITGEVPALTAATFSATESTPSTS